MQQADYQIMAKQRGGRVEVWSQPIYTQAQALTTIHRYRSLHPGVEIWAESPTDTIS
jgi:hypothetical protein